jgi:plasmid stabilization system protein ParE
MNVHKTDVFLADLERQFDWDVEKGGWNLAERYLSAVESACALLGQHPLVGPVFPARHPHLQGWRYFVVCRPFNKHLLFYEIGGGELRMRRAMHGRRNLRRRLVQ